MTLTNDAVFSHCLPLRRNVKATDAVMDSPRCIDIAEAETPLHVQTAVLAPLAPPEGRAFRRHGEQGTNSTRFRRFTDTPYVPAPSTSTETAPPRHPSPIPPSARTQIPLPTT